MEALLQAKAFCFHDESSDSDFTSVNSVFEETVPVFDPDEGCISPFYLSSSTLHILKHIVTTDFVLLLVYSLFDYCLYHQKMKAENVFACLSVTTKMKHRMKFNKNCRT